MSKKIERNNDRSAELLARDQRSLYLLYRRARFRISWVRVFCKLTLTISWALLNALTFLPFWLLRVDVFLSLKSFFYKGFLFILGVSYRLHGSKLQRGGVLYVSNHVSYMDIVVLMELASPRFLSRADILRLPFFGWLMRSYGTIGIERVRTKAREQALALRGLLSKGEPLLIFAEGTTSDGRGVLPMKSSLFAALDSPEARDTTLQPISIRYSLLDGIPMGTCWEPFFAWHGETAFTPHVYELLSMHRITVDIYLHPARPASQIVGGRKGLARFCEKTIREGLVLLRYGAPTAT